MLDINHHLAYQTVRYWLGFCCKIYFEIGMRFTMASFDTYAVFTLSESQLDKSDIHYPIWKQIAGNRKKSRQNIHEQRN